MVWQCLLCIWCHSFTSIASFSDIPGEICPSEGLGRLSTARLMTSRVMFIQPSIPFKNYAMGPDSRLGSKERYAQQVYLGPCNHVDHHSPFRDLHCCRSTADVEYWLLLWNLKLYIGIDFVYDIGYDIEDAPKRRSLFTRYCIDIEYKPLTSGTIFNFDALCTLDMYMISKFWVDIRCDVVLQFRDIRISKVKTLMSYMISVQCWDIRISKLFLRYQRCCRYLVW
jgi:hypothetical protein